MVDFYDLLGILSLGIFDSEKAREKRKEYHSDQIEPIKFDFTPSNLEEYIGQEKAKLRINTYIKKVMTIKPIHLLISGTRGHGKSTLAYIISNILGICQPGQIVIINLNI